MQRVRDFGQNLDPAMLFARGLGQPRSFQQAAQLACQDSGLRRQIVIEESWVGVMQENGGTDYFISDHQWSSHDRARMEFSRHAITKDRKSTRLNSSHVSISYAVFCLKKKNVMSQTNQ